MWLQTNIGNFQLKKLKMINVHSDDAKSTYSVVAHSSSGEKFLVLKYSNLNSAQEASNQIVQALVNGMKIYCISGDVV